MKSSVRAVILGVLAASGAWANLAAVHAEPNLEKRSRLALDNADAAYQQARKDFESGNAQAAENDLKELQESVELSHTALEQTHQDPSRKPKNFKYAETRTRDLLRKMKGWEDSLDSTDRPMVEPVRERIQEVHDSWLTGILGKKR
jgi:hypothetical protein